MQHIRKLINDLRSWKDHGATPGGARDVMEEAAKVLEADYFPPEPEVVEEPVDDDPSDSDDTGD